MRKILGKVACLAFLATLTTVALAAQSPIGTLEVQGRATIHTPLSTFTLQDQEYAYFSGDRVETSKKAEAMVRLSDGLNITFVGTAKGAVSRRDDTYKIDLEQGHILVKAEKGVHYRIFHNGKPVSPDRTLAAADTPFVVSVADNGDVQFYMPAQLDQQNGQHKKAAAGLKGSLRRAGVSAEEAAAILGALVTGGFTYITIRDDEGPSS